MIGNGMFIGLSWSHEEFFTTKSTKITKENAKEDPEWVEWIV